jgi:hypothetical protein
MYNPFDHWKELKCTKCVHADLCMQNKGGADLDIAADNCQHFKDTSTIIELPKKFWLVFNVPGFYHITEYDVDRISIANGVIDKMWGTSKHQKDVVYKEHFGSLVFFSEAAAEAGLNKLIEENHNDTDNSHT